MPVLRVRITNAASGAVRLDTRFPLDFLPGLAAFVPQARAPPWRIWQVSCARAATLCSYTGAAPSHKPFGVLCACWAKGQSTLLVRLGSVGQAASRPRPAAAAACQAGLRRARPAALLKALQNP